MFYRPLLVVLFNVLWPSAWGNVRELLGTLYLLYNIRGIYAKVPSFEYVGDFLSYDAVKTRRFDVLDEHMNMEIAWYICALGFVFKDARRDGRWSRKQLDIVFHHSITLFMICLCQWFNYNVLGLKTLWVLTFTNPLMDLGRIFKEIGMDTMALGVFMTFAGCFFYMRLYVYYVEIVRVCLFDCWPFYKDTWGLFGIYLIFNILHGVLYCMQWYWAGIIANMVIGKSGLKRIFKPFIDCIP